MHLQHASFGLMHPHSDINFTNLLKNYTFLHKNVSSGSTIGATENPTSDSKSTTKKRLGENFVCDKKFETKHEFENSY